MGRTMKRVPLDFNHPLNKVWPGYLSEGFPSCTACDGSGYSPEARAIANTFYPHQIGGPTADALAWHDKLGQAEVDYLVSKGRLSIWRDGKWISEPRTAADVNGRQRGRGLLDTHDGINRMLLVEFRCAQLGIVERCPVCAGHGDIATEEQRAEADRWEPTEPPTGDGYQLWETTSEGSPITPVFASLDQLCEYAASNCTTFGQEKASAEGWRKMLEDDFVAVVAVAPDGSKAMFL
jgi:hypothetical protein